MSIRGKLLTVVICICSALVLFCAISTLSYLRQVRAIGIANESLGNLYAVSRTRAAVLSQISQSISYILTELEDDKIEYVQRKLETNIALNEWDNVLKKNSGREDELLEVERAGTVKRIAGEISQIIDSAFVLGENGKKKDAYELLESDSMISRKEILFDTVDVSVTDEIRKVNNAYDEALLKLGLVAWQNEKALGQVENSRFFLSSLLMAYRVHAGVNKQDKELNDYVVGGEEEEIKGFNEHGSEVRLALNAWNAHLQTYKNLFSEYERDHALSVAELIMMHEEFTDRGHEVFRLKKIGDMPAIEKMITHDIEPLIHDGIYPVINEEITYVKREIERANMKLHEITFSAFLKAIIILVVISGVIIYLIITMMRGIIDPLEKLRKGTEIIRSGKLDHRIQIEANDELGQLAQSFDRMSSALQNSERKLRNLASGILTAQEVERKRISIGLHDDLGQSLSFLKLQGSAIKRKLPPDEVQLHEDCSEMLEYIDMVIKNLRHLSRDLSPPMLEDFGLTTAMRKLIEEFIRHYDLPVSVVMEEIDGLYNHDTQVIIFRIFQEGLTNIGKHAGATAAAVCVEKGNEHVSIQIEDDGVGFDLQQELGGDLSERGMGLAAMFERTRMIDASIDISTARGEGTRIIIKIPLTRKEVLHEHI